MIRITADDSVIKKAVDEHVAAIISHFKRYEFKGIGGCWNLVERWFKKKGHVGFEDVLRADPVQLTRYVQNRVFTQRRYPYFIQYIEQCFEDFSSGDGIGGRKKSEKRNGFHLAHSIGLTVCPYCNRNYITNLENEYKTSKDKVRQKRRTCHLDHFFDKKKYPFLALSFYNLIPSCGACNHLKGSEEIQVTPYAKDEIDNYIRFMYVGSVWDPKSLEVKIDRDSLHPDMVSNVDAFRLEELYNLHSDYVYEILLKKETYPETLVVELMRKYPQLYKTREDVLQIIYGNYLSKEKFQNRPLAKLASDILMQNDLG